MGVYSLNGVPVGLKLLFKSARRAFSVTCSWITRRLRQRRKKVTIYPGRPLSASSPPSSSPTNLQRETADQSVEIQDDDVLYRRLVSWHVKQDGTVSSAAYMTSSKPKSPDPQVSVNLARLSSIVETLSQAPAGGFSVGELRVSQIKALGLTVRRDVLLENKAHCLIEGLNSKDGCRRLAEITTVIFQPVKRQPNTTDLA